jgi:hypothetical protein
VSNLLIINQTLYQRVIRIATTYALADSSLQKTNTKYQNKNYILKLQNYKYLLNIKVKNSSLIYSLRSKQIGTLITDTFQTLTGEFYITIIVIYSSVTR